LTKSACVIVVMGSRSDLPKMKAASEILKTFNISVRTEILSAHRTPQLLEREVARWEKMGVTVIIAGAGGAAHLPGMLAAFSKIPVIGVPIGSKALNGLDSLLSIAQMPRGIPVATVAVDGAYNAGLLAIQIMGSSDQEIKNQYAKYKKDLNKKVLKDRKLLSKMGIKKFLGR